MQSARYQQQQNRIERCLKWLSHPLTGFTLATMCLLATLRAIYIHLYLELLCFVPGTIAFSTLCWLQHKLRVVMQQPIDISIETPIVPDDELEPYRG